MMRAVAGEAREVVALGRDGCGLAENRALIYGVLSQAYARPVDDALLDLLQPWGSLREGTNQQALPGLMRQGLMKMESWREGRRREPAEASLTAMEVEFTRLFRGLHSQESPPPPYGSVYRDGGLLYGPSTLEVARTYGRFRLKGKENEPPDHIALELDFMRFLCQKEALARQKGGEARDWLQEEGAFLEEHLASWVPALCQKIRGADTRGFYSGLADVTEGWLSCDRRIIRGLLGGEGTVKRSRRRGASLAVARPVIIRGS